jgi:serine/threonine protein kinase
MTTKYQPGVRVSEYVLEQCLGAGTFGEVWQGRHHIWESDRVAIKLPTEPEYVRYLQREGVVVHGLRHPNIIRVLGLDPYADTPYLIMELVKGPSLRDVITEHPTGLPIATATVVLRGLLRAMAAAHEAHVIHRDLKPGNVLLDLGGRPLAALTVDDVKIGDFGLGVANAETLRSLVEQSVSIERDAQSATLSGTLTYMAPEVRDGAQPPGPRSDLYSIGVVLFEMLTGARPAGAELPSAVRPEVPVPLDDLFRRLYTRFENRYETATAVLQDLDARLEALQTLRPRRPPPPPRPRRLFFYEALDTSGRKVRGEIRAVDRAEAMAQLERHEYAPTWLDEHPDGGPGPSPGDQRQPSEGLPGRLCPGCNTHTQVDDQFCTHCGAQLVKSVRRCASCGGYPGPHDNFCIFCGTALASSGE